MQLTTCLINWGHSGTPSIHLQLTAKASSRMNTEQRPTLVSLEIWWSICGGNKSVAGAAGCPRPGQPDICSSGGQDHLSKPFFFVNQNYHITDTTSGKIICYVDLILHLSDNFYLRLPFIRWRMGWTWVRLESALEEGWQLACQMDFYSLRLCSLLLSEMPRGGVVRFPTSISGLANWGTWLEG